MPYIISLWYLKKTRQAILFVTSYSFLHLVFSPVPSWLSVYVFWVKILYSSFNLLLIRRREIRPCLHCQKETVSSLVMRLSGTWQEGTANQRAVHEVQVFFECWMLVRDGHFSSHSFTRSKVGNFPVFYFIFRLVNSKRLSKPFEMER